MDETFEQRIERILQNIEVAPEFIIVWNQDTSFFDAQGEPAGRYYFQVGCWRKDTFTGEMGWGWGGKAYLSEYASDSELVQTAFGLYKAFWEHEARETFKWNGRRVFGPHISTDALWEVARRVDIRKPMPEGEK